MVNMLKIIDRSKVAGTVIYIVEIHCSCEVFIGDVFYDHCGKRFRLKSIEMFRWTRVRNDLGDRLWGMLFEYLDGTEPAGHCLVKNLSDIYCLEMDDGEGLTEYGLCDGSPMAPYQDEVLL